MQLLFANNSTPTDWNLYWDRKEFAKYLDDPKQGNGVVYSIVDSIAGAAQEMFEFVELLDNDGNVIEDHPALDLLNNPNDLDTKANIIRLMIMNLLTAGDVFVYGEWNSVSKCRSFLYVLPSADIEIEFGTIVDPIKGYKLLSSNKAQYNPVLTPENTLFFRLPNIDLTKVYGLSPLSPIVKDLETLDTAKRLQKKLLEEGGVRNIFCVNEFPSGANAEELLDILKARLNNRDAKTNQVFTVPLSRIQVGDSAADLALNEIVREKTQVICNAYNYPTNLFYSDTTYANLGEAKKAKYMLTIPYVNMLCESLTKFLKLSEGDKKLSLKLNTDQIEALRPDYTGVINSMAEYATNNEIREFLRLPKRDDSDNVMVSMGKAPLSEVIDSGEAETDNNI